MFRVSQNVQMSLNDRMLLANKQTQQAVNRSRAKLVGDVIYDNVEEERFAPLFSEKGSRPNIEIRRYVSALVLKRMYGLSDQVLLEFLRCGALNFQYALHTTQEETQPLSESSLRRFRRGIRLYNEENHCDLIKEEFERISRLMAVDMGLLPKEADDDGDEVPPILVRMDSMEIEAHAKVMTRLEILYTANVILLRYLLKRGMGNLIPAELSHYLADGDHNQTLYYRVAEEHKAAEQETRVAKTVREMVLLKETLEKNFTQRFLQDIPEYLVFQRVLEDQTQIAPDGSRVPKNKKSISPDSVQNPFDMTVTYRYKRGPHHGSVLNVAEAYDGNGNGIIVQADLKPNTESDNKMAEGYLSGLPDGGPKQVMTTDGAYQGEKVEELAREKNVELRATSLTGTLPDDIHADFTLNERGDCVLSCPAGREPSGCQYNPKYDRILATMPENCCASCPNREKCKARINDKKQKSTVWITPKQVRRAKQARGLSTEEGKKSAHQRNGVEGVMSVMRRKYGVDHIPVFGLLQSAVWIWTSLLSYNLVKYQKYKLAALKRPVAA